MASQQSMESSSFGSSIPIAEWLRLLWSQRVMLIASFVIMTAAGVCYALLATPLYRSTVAVVHSDRNEGGGGLSSVAGQFGGLAALAGIDVNLDDKQQEHLAYLQSDVLVRQFIRDEQLLPILFASQWDAASKKWKVSPAPTLNKATARFKRSFLSVREDKRTGTVEVSVLWKEPKLASKFANDLIERANRDLQARAIKDSQSRLGYLREEVKRTEMVAIQVALNAVVASELRTSMLANAHTQYAFKVIDPAVPSDPDDIARPQRVTIVAMAAIAGLMFGTALAFVRIAFRRR